MVWRIGAAFISKEIMPRSQLEQARPISFLTQQRWLLRSLFENEARGIQVINQADRKQRCPDWSSVIQQLRTLGYLVSVPGSLALTAAGRARAADELVLHPDGIPVDPPLRVHVGHVATVHAVMRGRNVFDAFSRNLGTILGLDMEASSLAELALMSGRRPIVIKAVVDFADETKDDRYREFSCRAAA
jgi:hypothetical protein